jgi:hypothetical protein
VQNVTCAECHLCRILFMPSVTNKPFMLSVTILNVVVQCLCLYANGKSSELDANLS